MKERAEQKAEVHRYAQISIRDSARARATLKCLASRNDATSVLRYPSSVLCLPIIPRTAYARRADTAIRNRSAPNSGKSSRHSDW
jgi:hypothetical protein